MKLSHLLLMMFLITALDLLFQGLLAIVGVRIYDGLLVVFLFPVAVWVAWPVSRVLRMSPLMIFSGPCPRCKTRPPGWWAQSSFGRKVVLTCGECGEQLELWLTRKPPIDLVSTTVPAFRLRWPEFLGVWCRVQPKNAGVGSHGLVN